MMIRTMIIIASTITITINPMLEPELPSLPEDTGVVVVDKKVLVVYGMAVISVVRLVVLTIAADVVAVVEVMVFILPV